MLKLIVVTLALGVFVVTGIATEVEAQYRLCSKAPKDPIPCTAQKLHAAKPQGKY
jgi:hypothetical protein